jgi:hypothetical protein
MKRKPLRYIEEDRGYATPCWIWQRGIKRDGYPKDWDGKRSVQAHRYYYEMHVGPIPEGLVIDHLCRVRTCVNPEHLEPVTHAENMRRSGPAQKTHCVNGHEFNEANTYIRPSGGRQCRACAVAATRRYADKKRQAA